MAARPCSISTRGAIRGGAPRVSDHVVTAGEDGSVRAFAYAEKREVFAARFDAPATALSLAPPVADEGGHTRSPASAAAWRARRPPCRRLEAGGRGAARRRRTQVRAGGKGGARPLLAAGEDGKVWFFACGERHGPEPHRVRRGALFVTGGWADWRRAGGVRVGARRGASRARRGLRGRAHVQV